MEPLSATGSAIAQKKKHPDDVRIAIVEDDPMFRHALEYHLEKIPGNRVFTFDSGEEYLRQYQELDPEILIIDYRLTAANPGGMNGLQILDNIKSSHHDTEVIFLSGQENLEVAASAIKKGASEYIIKDEKALSKMKSEVTRRSLLIRLKREQTRTSRWIVAIICMAALALLIGYFGGYEELSLPLKITAIAAFAAVGIYFIRAGRKQKTRIHEHTPGIKGERPGVWLD